MATLKSLCEKIGLANVKTYIASGNVVFRSSQSAKHIKAELESELRDYSGKDAQISNRTASELKAVFDKNPFASKKPNHTVALFLDKKNRQKARLS